MINPWKYQISVASDKETIPLISPPKDFAWEKLNARLASSWHVENVSWDFSMPVWQKKEDLEKRVKGTTLNSIRLEPLGASCLISLAPSEMSTLVHFLLGLKEEEIFLDDKALVPFTEIVEVSLLHLVEEGLNHSNQLIHQGAGSLEDDLYLTLSIIAHVGKEFSFPVLILLPEKFYEAWQKVHMQDTLDLKRSRTLESPVEISLDVGRIHLSYEDWSNLKLGDLILPDRLSWKPADKKAKVHLTFQGKTLGRARLRKGMIKVLPNGAQESIAFVEGVTMESKKEDEPIFSEEDTGEETELEGMTEEEDGDDEVPEESTPSKTAPQALQENDKPFDPTQFQVAISLELGRLQLTLEQLLALQPGNTLKFDNLIEGRVNLVIQGKVVGQGEIVSLGDVVGVRVLELG